VGISFFGNSNPFPLPPSRVGLPSLGFMENYSCPRRSRCAGSEPAIVRSVISYEYQWMSTAPSPQLQLSSLKLTWSTNPSTSSPAILFFSAPTVLAIAAQSLFTGVSASVLR